MGNPAGVKRDFVALERRRQQAARLLAQGVPAAEVARRVGRSRQEVCKRPQAATFQLAGFGTRCPSAKVSPT
jgi:hypothetical protein